MRRGGRVVIPVLLSVALYASVIFSAAPGEDPAVYDILIRGVTVYDGSLSDPFQADIAVRDGRIVKIARAIAEKAGRTIEARGLTVTPGFIDMHTHVDRDMYFPENRACLSFLSQGVTTVVVGQCGRSAWPIFEEAVDQIRRWTESGIGPNAALLVGHGSVREIVMGNEDREPTPGELEKMKGLVRVAMEQGASGISTGLAYMPGRLAKTSEIVELVKVVAPYGGVYHSHVRNEREGLLGALAELIEIAEKSGVPGHISHFKVVGKPNWGLSEKACALIEVARARGLTITADQYPYRFPNTSPYVRIIPRDFWTGSPDRGLRDEDIRALFGALADRDLIELYARATPFFPLSPKQVNFLAGLPRDRLADLVAGEVLNEGLTIGPENKRERMLFLERLADPREGEKIRRSLRTYLERIGPENFIVGLCAERELEGRTLAEVADLKGKSVVDAAIELDLMGAESVQLNMGDADIEYIMKKDYVATGSDGVAPFFGIGLPHIRSYGTFLYKIKEYALKRHVLTLAEAVRSQTSLAARIMNWKDRGWVKEGYVADLAILDLDGIDIPATISRPHRFSRGVRFLLINGRLAIDEGRYTGALAGRIIRPTR
jgi:N-acyl-D-amino-acid deacylase